ncbi:MAG: response regulator transcription factor [Acidobacteriaceae bacterium]
MKPPALHSVAPTAAGRERRAAPRFPSAHIRLHVIGCDILRAAGLQAIFERNPGIDVVVLEDMASLPKLGREADSTLNMAVVGPQGDIDILHMIEAIHASRPDLIILVMSHACGEEAILKVLTRGAKGMLHDACTPGQFEKAVHLVATGSLWAPRRIQAELISRLLAERDAQAPRPAASVSFTRREQQVLNLLLDGRANREIASSLNIEERTVKSYVTRLMRKMGVTNRTALSVRAQGRSLEVSEETPQPGPVRLTKP